MNQYNNQEEIAMPSEQELESGSLLIDQTTQPASSPQDRNQQPSYEELPVQEPSVQEPSSEEHHAQEQSFNTQPVAETAQSTNFKELRLAKERAEQEVYRVNQERDQYLKLLLQYEQQKNQPKVVQSEQLAIDQSYNNIDDDALVEGRHVKAYKRELDKMREEMGRIQSEYKDSVASQQFRSQCPDYDKVVTKDTISTFERLYPDDAHDITLMNDQNAQKRMAYRLIKRYGVYTDKTSLQEKQKISLNNRKPLSTAAVSPSVKTSTLSQASSYANDSMPSDAESKRLLAEMFSSSGNINGF